MTQKTHLLSKSRVIVCIQKLRTAILDAVRKQSDFENGNIVVILVDNDEGLVKKIYQDRDKVRLVSINPEYPDKIFKGEEICRLRVVGVVKQIIKMYKMN